MQITMNIQNSRKRISWTTIQLTAETAKIEQSVTGYSVLFLIKFGHVFSRRKLMNCCVVAAT